MSAPRLPWYEIRSLKEPAKLTECIGSEGGCRNACTVVSYSVYRSVVEGFSGEFALGYTSSFKILEQKEALMPTKP